MPARTSAVRFIGAAPFLELEIDVELKDAEQVQAAPDIDTKISAVSARFLKHTDAMAFVSSCQRAVTSNSYRGESKAQGRRKRVEGVRSHRQLGRRFYFQSLVLKQ